MTSAMSVETRLLTAGDLLRLDAKGIRGELIRGVLCETMPAGYEHGAIVVNLGAELRNFVKPRKLGKPHGLGLGRVAGARPRHRARAGHSLLLGREDAAGREGDRVRGDAPDLVVEVVSPSDTIREVNDKAFMWLGHGVRLVWLVYPETRTVDVYRSGRAVTTLTEDDSLDGLDVLPGFTCAVSEVFDD